jgi:tetratricopeptide (TPR) repeat protein
VSPGGADPEDRVERARAAYAEGDLEGAIAAWEALHADRLAAADAIGAAEAAAMVATHLLIDTGLMAPVRGWVGRAERLLEPHGELPVSAMLTAVRAYERFMCGDLRAARAFADIACAQAERHGNVEASVIAQTCQARLTLLSGDLGSGLAQLNEVGARLMAGEADALATGMMLCEVICAAQGLSLHDLAREWTEAMDRWRVDAAFGALHGRCRVHRAELLRLSGPVDLAEDEALAACAELRPWMRREYSWPLVELGTIRLRRGDLDGAEKVFQEALAHAWSPQPGLALARLARGEVGTAAAMVADAIERPMAIPSKEQPPFGDLRLAPLLHAQAEIAVASNDPRVCRSAAERLRAIADQFPSRSLEAMAAITEARADLLAGDERSALSHAQGAVETFADLGDPYAAAAARVVLGAVHQVAGRSEAARGEWQVARESFARFGARGKVVEVDVLLGSAAAPVDQDVPAVLAEFSAAGGLRTVRFAGHEAVVPDLKGYRYLERLLVEPGREFHVVDLAAVDPGEDDGVLVQQAGIPVLDAEARNAYRRRLAEVEEDIEEARANHDLARLELAERDRDYLVAELSGAVGLGGRERTTGGVAERARTSVTRTLRYALKRLAEHHPLAAGHLERSLNTGTYCSYTPDPTARVTWTAGPG